MSQISNKSTKSLKRSLSTTTTTTTNNTITKKSKSDGNDNISIGSKVKIVKTKKENSDSDSDENVGKVGYIIREKNADGMYRFGLSNRQEQQQQQDSRDSDVDNDGVIYDRNSMEIVDEKRTSSLQKDKFINDMQIGWFIGILLREEDYNEIISDSDTVIAVNITAINTEKKTITIHYINGGSDETDIEDFPISHAFPLLNGSCAYISDGNYDDFTLLECYNTKLNRWIRYHGPNNDGDYSDRNQMLIQSRDENNNLYFRPGGTNLMIDQTKTLPVHSNLKVGCKVMYHDRFGMRRDKYQLRNKDYDDDDNTEMKNELINRRSSLWKVGTVGAVVQDDETDTILYYINEIGMYLTEKRIMGADKNGSFDWFALNSTMLIQANTYMSKEKWIKVKLTRMKYPEIIDMDVDEDADDENDDDDDAEYRPKLKFIKVDDEIRIDGDDKEDDGSDSDCDDSFTSTYAIAAIGTRPISGHNTQDKGHQPYSFIKAGAQVGVLSPNNTVQESRVVDYNKKTEIVTLNNNYGFLQNDYIVRFDDDKSLKWCQPGKIVNALELDHPETWIETVLQTWENGTILDDRGVELTALEPTGTHV